MIWKRVIANEQSSGGAKRYRDIQDIPHILLNMNFHWHVLLEFPKVSWLHIQFLWDHALLT